MAVNPVNSGSNYVSQVQPKPQSYAERTVEKDGDKAREEASKAAAARTTAPPPTVNTSGQTVGAILNVKA